jgi:hypothetical protein
MRLGKVGQTGVLAGVYYSQRAPVPPKMTTINPSGILAGGRLHLCKDDYAAGKRPGVTEHYLRGRPVKPRRAGNNQRASIP